MKQAYITPETTVAAVATTSPLAGSLKKMDPNVVRADMEEKGYGVFVGGYSQKSYCKDINSDGTPDDMAKYDAWSSWGD